MIRVSTEYKKIDNVILEIPLKNMTNSYVKRGDKLKKGDKLFSSVNKVIIESHYLPKSLGIRAEKAADHIGRVSGQFVTKGDLLGERLMAGGLLTKKVIAGKDGVVSTERLRQGYLDILSESQEETHLSTVDGLVVEVNIHKSIVIECEGWGTEYHSDRGLSNNLNEEGHLTGVLELIQDGKSVYTVRQLAENYEGKIVFAGRYLSADVARELYKRDCKAIIAYSMDYADFRDMGIPIILLGGFGNISSELDRYDRLLANAGSLIQVDPTAKMIIIHSNSAESAKKVTNAIPDYENPALRTSLAGFLPQISKGQTIRSYELDSYGQSGKVVDMASESDSVIAVKADKSQLIASAENLEIVSDIIAD